MYFSPPSSNTTTDNCTIHISFIRLHSTTMGAGGYHNIFPGAVCSVVSATFGIFGIFSLIMAILLFYFRHHAGVASRHPLFSICHCLIAVFYCAVVIPTSCLIETPFYAFFLLRCFAVFGWFWASLCRYVINVFIYYILCVYVL